MDVIAVPTGSGASVSIDGADERLTWERAADLAHAHTDARWVWPDTAIAYPRLLAAGARPARCYDLRLCAQILRLAAPEAGAVPSWLDAGPAVVAEPTLLDGLDRAESLTPSDISDELERQQAAVAAAPDAGRLRLLLAAESAGALIAVEMHADGLPWSRERHDEILRQALGPRPPAGYRPAVLERLAVEIAGHLGAPHLNPDSPVELLKALRANGLDVTSTSKWEISRSDHPVVAPLLEYKKLARLLSANGWHWLDTWVQPGVDGRADRFRTDYVPGGVVTGRWATNGGGALQIPRSLRAAVVADPGWRLVVADAAQIEPRVLAAMAHDGDLARAGADRDLYAGLVDAGVVEDRPRAKVGMLGALYGGTTGESGLVLPRLRQAYPRAVGLVDAAARVGERGGTVRTWLGRTSPPPSEAWRSVQHAAAVVEASAGDERRARTQARNWGRFTRNFVVQGTAAEWALCWMAELRRRLRAMPVVTTDADGRPPEISEPHLPGHGRPHLVFFLHDEIVVHAPAELAEQVAA
ncbi:bifunctional 3'-5' exonuclease/DNA polymerase, partial [Pseudactinotalea sp.]|uniref:bifunctional 3'-5' exonuclease/DNA polymerase n=1 Tax=Pseudactinotalea sp. TaxID=1926260 RepID=UPI003B3A277A